MPPRWRDGHDVGVAHEVERGCGRVGALDPQHEAAATRRRLVALHLDAGAAQERVERVDAARFVTRLDGAVVHARVADEVLQEICGLIDEGGHVSKTLVEVDAA